MVVKAVNIKMHLWIIRWFRWYRPRLQPWNWFCTQQRIRRIHLQRASNRTNESAQFRCPLESNWTLSVKDCAWPSLKQHCPLQTASENSLQFNLQEHLREIQLCGIENLQYYSRRFYWLVGIVSEITWGGIWGSTFCTSLNIVVLKKCGDSQFIISIF